MRFGKSDSVEDDLDMLDGDDAVVEEEAIQQPLTSNFLSGGAGGGAAPEADLDYSSLSEGSKVMSKSTLLVVLVMAIAGGSLYAMHLSQVDHSATEDQKKAEARIDQLMAQLNQPNKATITRAGIDAMFKDMDSVLGWLNNDRTKSQVPVEFTRRNPFALLMKKTEVTADVPKVDEEAKRLAELRARLDSEARKLKLQSVSGGRTPVAFIDGKFIKVGGQIGSFTVREIKDVGVLIEAEGQQFMLTLGRDPNNPSADGVRFIGDDK